MVWLPGLLRQIHALEVWRMCASRAIVVRHDGRGAVKDWESGDRRHCAQRGFERRVITAGGVLYCWMDRVQGAKSVVGSSKRNECRCFVNGRTGRNIYSERDQVKARRQERRVGVRETQAFATGPSLHDGEPEPLGSEMRHHISTARPS